MTLCRCVGRGAKTTSKVEDNILRLLVHAAPAGSSDDQVQASEDEDGTGDEGLYR